MKKTRSTLAVALLAASCLVAPAHATTYTATTNAQVHTAYNAAVSGDTILIAPGNYTQIDEEATKDFGPAGLLITAQDTSNKPHIVSFRLLNATKVTVSYLHMSAQDACCNPAVLVQAVTDVTFDHNNVDGNGGTFTLNYNAFVSGGPCVRCAFTYNTVHDAQNGFLANGYNPSGTTLFDPGPILIDHNEIYGIYENGGYFSGATHLTVSNNTVHDFIDPGDGSHPDGLQFEHGLCQISGGAYSADNCPDMTDIEIAGNVIYRGVGAGYAMQGILVGGGYYNRLGAGFTQHHQRFNIHDNAVCMDGQYNLLAIDGVKDLIDTHNFEQGTVAFPGRNLMTSSDTITLTNNTGDGVGIGSGNVNVIANSGNISISSNATYDCTAMNTWLGIGSPVSYNRFRLLRH